MNKCINYKQFIIFINKLFLIFLILLIDFLNYNVFKIIIYYIIKCLNYY